MQNFPSEITCDHNLLTVGHLYAVISNYPQLIPKENAAPPTLQERRVSRAPGTGIPEGSPLASSATGELLRGNSSGFQMSCQLTHCFRRFALCHRQ